MSEDLDESSADSLSTYPREESILFNPPTVFAESLSIYKHPPSFPSKHVGHTVRQIVQASNPTPDQTNWSERVELVGRCINHMSFCICLRAKWVAVIIACPQIPLVPIT